MAFLALVSAARAQGAAPHLTHGPLRGHVDTENLHLWARAGTFGTFVLHLENVVDGTVATCTASASPENDATLHFHAAKLTAATAYDWWITCGEIVVHARGPAPLVTAMRDDAGEATVAFGSCAHERAFPEQPIWGQILARAPHALVLLGDTPYIDLGTVEGRRRRHREFFAFPPVRAALAAIPTWTTWDDHDYAANDEFGGVPGSETARPVFVEYHAHASFGDGERGIYTSFRRGPVEVFVLDTRTFADGEESLLSKAQTRWLQQGLLRSTAAFRVLACGMVWNGGVRAGKKDCWGHWPAERDALLRWIGEHRVAGVVLISGDVHRSRVIVHPTAGLAGYDVTELVTSPLAQNVLESNAVPVPGLVFDAGEPQSCLFLAAARTGDRAVLRATFVAGDGREFHTREMSLASLTRPDAAAHYRTIVRTLRERFGATFAGVPEVQAAPEPGPSVPAAEAVGPAWRAAVASAACVWPLCAAAAAETRCRFSPTSGDTMLSEFMQDVFLGLQHLQRLLAARAFQALADGDADAAVASTNALLAMARHLHDEPSGIAWSVAATLEQDAAALVRHAGTGVAADAMREAVRQHLQRRRPVGALGIALRGETRRLLDGTLAAMRIEGGAAAKTVRQSEAELRRRFLEHTNPVFAALEAAPDDMSAGAREELSRLVKDLSARWEERWAAWKALREADEPGPDAKEDVALMFAALLMPPVESLVDGQLAALRALREAVR